MSVADFAEARKSFHASLLKTTLTLNGAGMPSNADKDSKPRGAIAKGIAELLKAETIGKHIASQTAGNQFESSCADFMRTSFLTLGHLRPPVPWDVASGLRP